VFNVQVARNKVVSVTYTITDESGDVVEQIDVPVSYLHGREGGLFLKIERALEGKGVGDQVEVSLSPAEGFGDRDPDLTFSDRIENVPPAYRKLGAKAEFVNEAGEKVEMTVTHVDAGTVTLDGNHPFAGKTITFRVTVAEIRDARPDELASGTVSSGSLH
jgi:FKBP-type peptidyl-prolyl cis-trans isomerase SlyD